MKRYIFLVDMNSFYVSCELLRKPEYKKKAVVIAHQSKRSVITAASYMAKDKGIDSAMSLHEALRQYPQLQIIEPDFSYYQECSKKIMHFLQAFSSEIEIASLDEAYIDVTHYFEKVEPTIENVLKLANFIQKKLLKTLGFAANIGISTNKFLAKMASELKKPFAIESIYTSEVPTKLWPLSIEKMHGIGRKTASVLKYLHINTIGDFANFENEFLLYDLFGKHILEQQALSQGHEVKESTKLQVGRIRQSISKSQTFLEDTNDAKELENKLVQLWQQIEEILVQKKLKIRNIRVTYKNTDFKSLQRSHTFLDYQNDFQSLQQKLIQLFHSMWDGEAIRLIGVGVTDFIDIQNHAEQLNMFEVTKNDNQQIQLLSKKKQAVMEFVANDIGNSLLSTGNEIPKKD